MSRTEPAVLVVRFNADTEGRAATEIMRAVAALATPCDAWMGIREYLDGLNVTLTGFGWPPRTLAVPIEEPTP